MKETLLTVLLLGLSAFSAPGQTNDCQQFPGPNPGAQLGCSVDLKTDSLVLGANLDGAGSVTPCQRNAQKKWVCGAKLTSSDGRTGDEFGRSAVLGDDWLAVGAPFANGSGVVYLFRNEDGGWVERQKLSASDGAKSDQFGLALSLSGDILMVGAPNHAGRAGSLSGAVYVFRFDGERWIERQKLTASAAAPFDNFGFSISVDSRTVVVGAPFRNQGRSAGNAGAVYVFERDGNGWSERTRLTAGDAAADDQFGSAVAVSGDALAVGARGDDENRGSAYVYERRTGWTEVAHFFGEAKGDRFGVAASISGNRLLIGALLHDGNGSDSGAAYLFERRRTPDGTFRWEPDGNPLGGDAAGDRFGQAVAIHGQDLLVGAYLADIGAARDAGSAKVCRKVPPPTPRLRVEKTDHRKEVSPGETVTYTITVSNDGDGAAPAVLVTDTFSSKLTGVSWCAPQIGQSCANPVKGNINRTISLASKQSVVFTATGTVKANASGTLSNSACAQILPEGAKECTDDPPDEIRTQPPPTADLRLDKSAPVRARPGDRIVYTLTVTNLGPDTATGVHLEDTIPEGLQFVGAPGCSTGNGKISCDLPDLARQKARSVQLTFDVLQTCLTKIVNRATVSANEEDLHPEDDFREVSTLLVRTASLAVEKTGPATVKPGDSLLYTVKVTNTGPDLACGVVLNDPIPAGLTSPVAPGGCESGANGIRCPIGELPPSESRTFTIGFTAPQEPECGSKITNTATVTAAGSASKTAMATATVNCGGDGVVDLSISKTAGSETAEPGETLSYEIVVRNLGTVDADATVTDAFPAELTNVRWCRDSALPPCTPQPAGDLHDILPLAAGAKATYRVEGIVAAMFTGTLVNTASVALPPELADKNPSDNSADAATEIGFSGVKAFCKDISGANLEGGMITYTFVLLNGGPAVQMDNPGDEFTDTLPAGLTLTGAAATSGITSTLGNTARWNGSIPVGGMVTVTINATINAGTAGTAICNQASIAFDTDGDGINESNGLSDDPGLPGSGDPCCFPVLAFPAIPALSVPGLLALALFLSALALLRLRRPSPP